jgi:cytoskeletal protein RodZ
MGSLGETLRQARLDRGVSVAEAEQETHIRRRYLEALESEDYGALPAQVYTRGFIRTYARYLGLDPEATLDLFSPGRVREDRSAIRPATPQLGAGRPLSVRLFLLIAGLVLSVLLLFYLWTQYTSFVESIGQTDRSATAQTATPTRAPEATTSPAGAAAAPAQPAPPSPATSPTPQRGIVLDVRVTERTWIEVWVDGSSQLQATLQAGSARSFTANQSIRMRVGNAGGVEATVNGQPQGRLGERYQVKEFVWER